MHCTALVQKCLGSVIVVDNSLIRCKSAKKAP